MKARVSVFVVVMVLCSMAQAVERQLIDLGTSGGMRANWPNSINNRGEVVGDTGDGHAFIYSNGAVTNIDGLSGASSATGINNHGQVTGYVTTPDGMRTSSFVYAGGTVTDIGTLGGTLAEAYGINDSGEIVGELGVEVDNSGESHAFLYSGGNTTDLGGDYWHMSWANGINNPGQVVGHIGGRAFLHSGGATNFIGPETGFSYATSINDLGTIVGNWSVGQTDIHAFLYANGVMSDIGTLGGALSHGYDINNRGQVVGESEVIGSTMTHAFLYQDGQMIDLNTLLSAEDASKWVLMSATSINDNGWIVGVAANYETMSYNGFLLTPEPGTIVLLAAGGMMLRRRQKARRSRI